MIEDVKIGGKDKDYLVDVMRVWDCYAQDWVADSPVLLRFESDDVLILAGERVFVGPVLAERPFEKSISEEVFAYIDLEDKCLCWLSDQAACDNVGEYVSAGEAFPLELERP